MAEFRMPSLGADMEAGTVLEWLVAPGDQVHRGDPVAVVDTAKAAVEVEVFSDGVVRELLVPVGEHVAVGTPLALLDPLPGAVGAAAPTAAAHEPSPAPVEPSPAPVPPSPVPLEPSPAPVEPSPAPVPAPPYPEPLPAPEPSPVPPPAPVPGPQPEVASPLVRHLAHQRGVDLARVPGTGPRGAVTRADVERATARVRSSPYARRRAAELGVALAGVRGSGPAGAVLAADVEKAVPTAAPDAAPVPEPRRTGAQQEALKAAVAELMARSKREVPHYYLSTTVDLLRATQWLREQNLSRPVTERLLPVALLLKATAAACRAVPELNGTWEDDRFVPGDGVHLGVAVALRGGGLVAPALRDVDRLGVGEVMRALQDLVTRARAGRLRRRELTDATLTVTNLGDLGVDEVLGVIFPPQVALVGFGRVVERPWAVDGLLGVRPVVTATLSADHRASSGHVGARFLTEVDRWLQRPERYEQTRPAEED